MLFFYLGLLLFLKFFSKKLIPLLFLEIFMIFIILVYFNFCSFFSSLSCVIYPLIFLVFMVLDSVLGISLLLMLSRSSTKISFSLA